MAWCLVKHRDNFTILLPVLALSSVRCHSNQVNMVDCILYFFASHIRVQAVWYSMRFVILLPHNDIQQYCGMLLCQINYLGLLLSCLDRIIPDFDQVTLSHLRNSAVSIIHNVKNLHASCTIHIPSCLTQQTRCTLDSHFCCNLTHFLRSSSIII